MNYSNARESKEINSFESEITYKQFNYKSYVSIQMYANQLMLNYYSYLASREII